MDIHIHVYLGANDLGSEVVWSAADGVCATVCSLSEAEVDQLCAQIRAPAQQRHSQRYQLHYQFIDMNTSLIIIIIIDIFKVA